MLICPNCKKKYRSNILVCPNCKWELLPPSVIKLQTDHPDLKPAPGSKKQALARKPTRPVQTEAYVELIRGNPIEVKETRRLLEKEGVACRIESDETAPLPYTLDGENPMGSSQAMVVRVPVSQIEKARALLDWENQKEEPHPAMDKALAEDQEDVLVCPACESEVIPEEGTCPECGWEFDLGDETDEEEYFCSSCGESCDPDDPVCPNCGAHFDH
ncbi:MAG TPA: zinc ribbon domain-containing protein [Nitrospiria bacterium]|nr:zinc ribbon domain-containing protein [Nitrospiria bacterium]